jgi:hypothetical protein
MRREIFIAALLAAMPACLVHAQSQAPDQVQDQAQEQVQDQAQDRVQSEMQSQLQDQLQNAVPDQALHNATPDQAQNQTQPGGQPSAIAYRGTFVCEKAPGSVDILRVPADMAVRGDQVQFARPLFNLGTLVLGSEMGAGSIDPSGTVHLTSTWNFRGITVHGDYHGTLTQGGGTLTGIQSWRGRDGTGYSRTCQVALVVAANANRATMQ